MTPPSMRDLEQLARRWFESAAMGRQEAANRAKQHEARAYVLERANILEECAKQLKAVLDGPQYKLCRCGRQITPTPVGTWKHVQKIPMSTQNHLARPA